MKKLLHKLVFSLVLGICSINVWAQTVDKSYSEVFNTNKDVSITLDTRHTDVVIETWNKSKVEVVATIAVEGASNTKKEEIINNWKFKALGNKKDIEVTSKSSSSLQFDFPMPIEELALHNMELELPDVSLENLKVLDSLEIILPDELHFPSEVMVPHFDAYHFSMDSIPFDFEKFKKDEKYLKAWQEQLKEKMEEMKLEWQEQSQISRENAEQLKEELKRMQIDRQKVQEERNKRIAEYEKQRSKLNEERQKFQEERKKRMEEYAEQRAEHMKERAKYRKEIMQRRQEELQQRRLEVKKILEERDKIKIKRTLTIKAPKDAKFNMNVKYGTIRFAE